jgi:hypothetical protein
MTMIRKTAVVLTALWLGASALSAQPAAPPDFISTSDTSSDYVLIRASWRAAGSIRPLVRPRRSKGPAFR